MSDEILFEVHGESIAIITLNRPAQRNAINRAVTDGMYDAFERFEKDNALRAAILTGAGTVFCAGADLKEMAGAKKSGSGPGSGGPRRRSRAPVLGDTIQCSKPVIAAVNGPSLGAGFLFSQMCDLCVASTAASFGITEARWSRGFPWAAPLIHMLPQRIMLEMMVTARPISAQRAFDLGLVNHLVEPAQLMPKALEIAGYIVENAPLTVAAAKELVALVTDMGRSAAMRAAVPLFDRVYNSADAIEGPLAFKEKRKPRWRGE